MENILDALEIYSPEDFDALAREIYTANRDEIYESLHNNEKYLRAKEKLLNAQQELLQKLSGESKERFEQYLEEMDMKTEDKNFASFKRGFTMALIIQGLSQPGDAG
ncbi:MAG: hypothetical protein FWC62_08335 [Firmicutes bacterium]|nr:hypothetical protein [Bacillota bacterium]